MTRFKRIVAALAGLAIALCALPKVAVSADSEAANTHDITIDGSRANTKENMLYKGNGMVSGNNTSRLLMDYKAQSPQAYAELLEYLFGESGLRINHLKVEMGSDINSSSGTEPAVMRYEDEKAD